MRLFLTPDRGERTEMVDFDLSELSAPLESLRAEVKAAYKRLDSKWQEITDKLKKLPIPCDVSYTYWESDYCPADCTALEFKKWKGSKRICLVSYGLEQTPYGQDVSSVTTPYDEWSGEQRVEMLEHVPGLFEAAVKQTKDFIERTKDEKENQL
jgi:hypothetical protein